ncbi:MAG: zinc ribbon domain-containing protein [Prevotella sp.]|nr:zinc ribbon domain-containing protein [Prevotella sp.]
MEISRKCPFVLAGLCIVLLCLTGCYGNKYKEHDALVTNNREMFDSAAYARQQKALSFFSQHHYTTNYNFVVKTDSMVLSRHLLDAMEGWMSPDTFVVRKHEHLVVADFRIVPDDSVDSVWVQLARDQFSFGWVHESELLSKVVPDDPISQFISVFSDVHLLIFLVVICLISVTYFMRMFYQRNAKIVHFNDIGSVYPTLLALLVATSSTLYATIQVFAPEMWRHFYYHPTLNPFNVPPILTVFLILVWAILIVSLACIDVVRRHLPMGEAMLYLCGLVSVCAVNYIVFGLTTLYYVGYVLLVLYFYYAVSIYRRKSYCKYSCGNCGKPLQDKGICPYCGAFNE